MARPLSPIHRPLDPDDVEPAFVPAPVAAVPSRISRLAALDRRVFSSGHLHSLGAGGASSAFTQAVTRALIDELAEQLREGPLEIGEGEEESDIRRWAAEIISAFDEGDLEPEPEPEPEP